MRVQIDHVEMQKGLIIKRTYHAVRCEVVFSEEELHIIKQLRLQDEVVMERLPSAELKVSRGDDMEPYYLYVKTLLRGADLYCMETPNGARIYEEGLIENLKEMKEYLAANAEGIAERSKTLEF